MCARKRCVECTEKLTLLEDIVIFILTGEFSGQEKMNSEMLPVSSPLGSLSAMKLGEV